jgi:hypothetical protein
MINVKNGTTVKGDGIHDDQPGLQAMINDQQGALCFPPGEYLIKRTLTFPPRTGHQLVGCGMAQVTNPAHFHTGCRAAIVWGGGSNCDGIMIDYRGSGLVWNGLSLWGRPFGSTDPRAKVGVRICPTCSPPPCSSSSSSSSEGATIRPGGKMWLPAIMIVDCETGIQAGGDVTAGSCAFGYLHVRECAVGMEFSDSGATMYTFRFILPSQTSKIFKVTGGGGRVYVASINVIQGPDYVLDISEGEITNGFFHINDLTIDGGNTSVTLLENVDSGNGLTHVRFTNMQFARNTASDTARINIDRTKVGGGSTGQTVVELVGCRGLTLNGDRMTNAVTIKGASSSKPSRLISRDCELPENPAAAPLIDTGSSSHFTENRIKNWLFKCGSPARLAVRKPRYRFS